MFEEHDSLCIVYVYFSAVNFTDLTDYCTVFLIDHAVLSVQMVMKQLHG